MEDHRSEDGNINWASYKKAQKENGEYCYKCGALIVLGRGGYRRSCYQCDELRNGSSVTHNKFIRCPKCELSFSPYDSECYELLSEGEHSIHCIECNHCFEIETSVQYSFRSPDLIKEDEEDVEDVEDEE